MNGFGCCGQKLLTFSLHVNWNLSPGSESFWFTRHFSEMNGLPLLTRWEQQGSGVRCYMCIYWVCACACIALVTASKAKAADHEVFTLCLLFNLSCHHSTILPFNLKNIQTMGIKEKAVLVTLGLAYENVYAWTLTPLPLYSALPEAPQTWGRQRW